jgi:hypothetical protein
VLSGGSAPGDIGRFVRCNVPTGTGGALGAHALARLRRPAKEG